MRSVHDLIDVDKAWTLFLDRDGVINKKIDHDYVKNIGELEILPGVLEALYQFNNIFNKIVIVTNQQGIGKGLMTEVELTKVHEYIVYEVHNAGGRIDEIYYCPHLKEICAYCRKPNVGMALNAQKDFPSIDFSKSIMVGDSVSDMEFGEKCGMLNVFVGQNKHILKNTNIFVSNLLEFSNLLLKYKKPL
jgi:histidinol-phosphate phosphatase family protein